MRTHHRLLRAAVPAGLALALLVPAAAGASALSQIDTARAWRAAALDEGLDPGPVLSKHYVEIAPGVWFAVKGERERRQIRTARWVELLGGDRARILGKAGFPPHRWFESGAGIRSEFWSYPAERVTYVFRGDELVDSRIR